MLLAECAVAQSKLGELLDAGASKLSADEFRQELVQHLIVGPTAAGANLELMYVSDGRIVGKGTDPLFTGIPYSAVGGEWKIDDSGKVCTSMRIGNVTLPSRCQSWFKYKDQYFLSDSDSDRQARVLVRTIKQ
ncbi:MAG TPA: hypothetical protein VJV74_04505 [Terriglobia bacterium]|nr:hypothetical protein [Terriglobia bacterium]